MCRKVSVIVLVSVCLIGHISADLGFPILSSSIQEGASSSFSFGQFGPDDSLQPGITIYCRAKIEQQSTATLNTDFIWSVDGTTINNNWVDFQLKDSSDGGPEEVVFKVQSIDDNLSDDGEQVHVHVNCYTDPSNILFSTIFINNCNYKLSITDTESGEDPHFMQNVLGKNENNETVIESICYDLTGTAGDVFELLTDDRLGM